MNFLSIIHTQLMWQLLHNGELCAHFKKYVPFNPSTMELACKNWTKSELMDMSSLELISILQYSPGQEGLEYILLCILIGIPMILLWMSWKFVEILIWNIKILYEESVRRNENIFITSLRFHNQGVIWGMILFAICSMYFI